MKFHITLLNLALFVGLINADEQQTRIIHGRDADIRQHPYQVSLRTKGAHFCGGIIISNRHILTAAHCIEKYFIAPYTDETVHAGSSDLTAGGHTYRVAGVKSHPEYQGQYSDQHNDIGIITLSDTISFDGTTQKINLPSSDIRDGDKAVLTGWGVTDVHRKLLSHHLQQADMTLVSSGRCKLQLPDIFNMQVCAVQVPLGGACFGDSGGPLVVKGEVVGITSWAVNECDTSKPDVFTKVYAYKSFIDSVIRGGNTH